MKKLPLFVAIALIVVTIGIPATSLSAHPVLQETVVAVYANRPWTDTGIDITAGSIISITATGTIRIAGSDPGKTPAGDPNCSGGTAPDGFLAPGLICWSLIGRIGTGQPFQIGAAAVVTADQSGRLYLGVNDDVFGDNTGYWTATVSVSECNLNSIQIDESSSNGVVSGSVSGLSPCDAVLEIHNNRTYWVNLNVVPYGGVTLWPAGGANNSYAIALVLGPGESVNYLASFSSHGQSVIARLDVTTHTGQSAQRYNLAQAIVDLASVNGILPGIGQIFRLSVEAHQDIINTFGRMTHLSNAATALFSFSPGSLGVFTREFNSAVLAGEFEALGEMLERQRLDGAADAFKLTGGGPGRLLSLGTNIFRNYRTVHSLLTGDPAGFVVFLAE